MQPAVLQDEDHAEFRRDVQNLIKDHITPQASQWRKNNKFPDHLLKICGDNDLIGISQPKDVGGCNKDFWYEVILAEELAQSGVSGWVLSFLAHTNMLIPLLVGLGSTSQQESVLPTAMAGECYLGLAATEPSSGSDMVNISMTAQTREDTLLVNGEKKYITNGSVADYLVTLVRTAQNKGSWSLSLLLIDTGLDGVTQNRLDTVGLKTGDTAHIQFSDVEVPDNQLLGKEGNGLPYLLDGLQRERLIGAVSVVALADHVLNKTLRHLQSTERFRDQLTDKQVIRHRLAKLHARLESIRQFTYATVAEYANEDDVDKEILMLKIHVYKQAQDIISTCAHLYGAESFLEDSWISHINRSAQAFTFAAGTSEVMCDLLAEYMQI